MKILILSNYANGLYLFRKELISEMLRKDYSVIVSVPPDENLEKVESLGCRVVPIQFERRGHNPVHDIKLFFRYLSLIRREKPDVVLTYTIKPHLYGGIACRLCRIPYIANVTGLGTAMQGGGLLSKVLITFYKIALKKARCIFFQNEANKLFMQKLGIAKTTAKMLPGSGVNLAEHPYASYPSEDDGIQILLVARVMKDKGIEEFFDAAKMIHEERKEIQFTLVGEYEKESQDFYEPWIKELSEKGILKYLGHIDYVPEVMARSHIILNPSYHEGLSNVLLEAAACGRPIAATNIPGCKETVLPGISGLLFEPKNTESLLDAIKEMLGYSASQREEMGKKGREYIEKVFDRNVVIEAYMKEIQDIQG